MVAFGSRSTCASYSMGFTEGEIYSLQLVQTLNILRTFFDVPSPYANCGERELLNVYRQSNDAY